MNPISSGSTQAFNLKLLQRREEAEKMIMKEHSNIKSKLKQKKEYLKKEMEKLELMQEESSSLTNRSAILSGEVSKMKIKNATFETNVKDTIYKIDEIRPQQMLAATVLEKEEESLRSHCVEMERLGKKFNESWENSKLMTDISELENKQRKLRERNDALEDQISRLKEKCNPTALSKLTEECMVLRKRNAALLKRKSKILETLEKQIADKKQELSRAKRNVTFKFS